MNKTGTGQREENDGQDGVSVGRREEWIGQVQCSQKRRMDRTGFSQRKEKDEQNGFIVERKEELIGRVQVKKEENNV